MADFDHHDERGEPVGSVAAAVLASLYAGVAGAPPSALRAYQEEDTLLLLLRFDPALLGGAGATPGGSLLDSALDAMPALVAELVHRRTGRTLVPGNLSVSTERGLAVFAFAVLEEGATDRYEPYTGDGGLRLNGWASRN